MYFMKNSVLQKPETILLVCETQEYLLLVSIQKVLSQFIINFNERGP